MKYVIVVIALGLILCGRIFAQQGAVSPDDDKDERISNLLERALKETSPDEQIRLYTEVLKLDPNNQNAFVGIRDAKERMEKSRKEDDKQASDNQARERALQDGETAVRSGDLEGAQIALEAARKFGSADPGVSRLAGLVRDLADYKRHVQYAAIALGAILLAGVGALLISFTGKRVPYLEALDGPSPGRRYQLEKDVTLIGSVAKYAGGENDIVIDDEQALISPCQCEIHRRDGKHYLFDCNSGGGTQVDRERIPPEQPVMLRNGARIELAAVRSLRFGMERKKNK